MQAKKRNGNSNLSQNKRVTRHFYIPNNIYDNLIKESENKDIPVSRLLEQKLQLLDKIKFEILRFDFKGDINKKNGQI